MKAPITYEASKFADIKLEDIDAAIIWEQRDAPRAEAYYASRDVPYTYGRGAGVRTYTPHVIGFDTNPVLAGVWNEVEELVGSPMELLFCNRYASEREHLGWHADDGELIDHTKPIIVVSFGAERAIFLRENGATEMEKLILGHGSVLTMHAGMQQQFQHRIPKHSAKCGARVSLTFRGLRK